MPEFLTRPDGLRIANNCTPGKGPGVIFCGGLMSDMEGSKAMALENWAKENGRAFVRFDYFGHGRSDGDFIDGTISRWAEDTLAVLDELTQGPQIIIGSSMGGWTSLLTALARPERVKGLILIAPAPDFTEKLMWAGFDAQARKAVMEQGVYYQPSDYDAPYPISKALIEDGRARQILDAPIPLDIPVRILQGAQDKPVPHEYSRQLVDLITSEDVTYTLVKDGDHSLSRPQDLARLMLTLGEVSAQISA